MAIYERIEDMIGKTPMLEPVRLTEHQRLRARLFAKLEMNNPMGSAKDRAALYMIRDAQMRGLIRPGGIIIEPTSGNTGIGLAYIGRLMGYQVILTMPDSMSVERRQLLAALGAQIELTPGAQGMEGASERARQLQAAHENAWIAGQFENPANAQAHYETTGPEIYMDIPGGPNAFVCGVGTGGTLTGTGRYLREMNPQLEIIAVEPYESQVLSGGAPALHTLQGIGANFIPKLLDVSLISRIMPIGGDAARQAARLLLQTEGVMTGFSGGAVLAAAMIWCREPKNEGKSIVCLLPDRGERYLSTDLFDATV